MGVSRETHPFPEVLYNKIKQSIYYEHLFGGPDPVCLKNCASGFLSLLFSIKALHDKNGLLIITDPGVKSERLYLDIYDLVPKGVFFAPYVKKTKDRPDSFVSEEEKNFEAAYTAIVSESAPIIISSAKALNLSVYDPKKNMNRVVLKKASFFPMGEIVKKLSLWGYESVDPTVSPRSFSVRGGILDIFPLYSSTPVRIEFFGDKIESIRSFNPVSQLSISVLEEFVLCAPSGFSVKEKIPFSEIVSRSIKQRYYINKNSEAFSVANNPDFVGSDLSVDCSQDKKKVLSKEQGFKIFVFASTALQNTKLKERFGDFTLVSKPLRHGFVSKNLNLAVLGYGDLNLVRPSSSVPATSRFESSVGFGLANVGWGILLYMKNMALVNIWDCLLLVNRKTDKIALLSNLRTAVLSTLLWIVLIKFINILPQVRRP